MNMRLESLRRIRECRDKIWAFTTTASDLLDRRNFIQTMWGEFLFSDENGCRDAIIDETRKAFERVKFIGKDILVP